MKYCPIFITSADSYSDLWPAFFTLFKKYWPEYSGPIYLNTQTATYQHEGLDIRCTRVGNGIPFGQQCRAALDQIEGDVVLLMMIDFFFMGRIDDARFRECMAQFESRGLDSLCFFENPYSKVETTEVEKLYNVPGPSKDMFSFQIALWKKDVLREMALPHEDPWLSEWYGTLRANKMGIKLAFMGGPQIFPYLASGALQKGKWVPDAKRFLETLPEISIDYSVRGIHSPQSESLAQRARARKRTFVSRVRSNIDLLNRKPIHR